MEAILRLVAGGKEVVVRPELPTVIGRGVDASLRVPDSMISRRHCELYEYEGRVAIRDLGSVNGTVVNGHRIDQDTLLSPGDLIAFGRVTFRLEDDDAVDAVEEALPVEFAAEGDDAVAIADDGEASVQSGSAVVRYQSTGEGSVIEVYEEAEAIDDAEPSAEAQPGDSGLMDFLEGLDD
ncbi:MAG: FHA domain-containing protein [Planctomycetales bacterium]|nr:FHA domain-containing protein [Planctomycetales bacterium]